MESIEEKMNLENELRDSTTVGKVALEAARKSGETVNSERVFCMEAYPFLLEEEDSERSVFDKMGKLLPYWKELGINTIWVAPVYPSPREDMGYDIADYKAIDRRFGTMDDFDRFVEKAHDLDQRVLMDLVLNHTSDEHEWFKKALDGDPKYRNFYYFTDNPQEGWKNLFDEESAWEQVPGGDKEYYLHSFHKRQPDLKWFNENGEINTELLEEFREVIDFWTKEHKVDGFRLDVPQAIDKDFSDSERNFETLMFNEGKQSSLVVEKLFRDRPKLLTTIEVFDPLDDGVIMSRYAGPGKPIQFAMNAYLAMQSEEEKALELFSNSIEEAPYLMLATQSHDTSRKDPTGETTIKLIENNPGAICLYMGQEIGLKNPTKEEYKNKEYYESDAQASMRISGKIRAKEAEIGRILSEEEVDKIKDEDRRENESDRAQNRKPISQAFYEEELNKQSVEPNSTFNRFKEAGSYWLMREPKN